MEMSWEDFRMATNPINLKLWRRGWDSKPTAADFPEITGAIAAVVPVCRAAAVDPLAALRCE
jgi:hypothetical protein